jgi:ABC-type oligopeptide transport system ATPase subunit
MSQERRPAPLLEVRELTRLFGHGKNAVHAVNRVSFSIVPGEIVAVVGESGSGKTTLARLVLRLLDPTSGQVLLHGQDVTRLRGAGHLKGYWRRVQGIFQDPFASFNQFYPVLRVLENALRLVAAPVNSRSAAIGRPLTPHGEPGPALTPHGEASPVTPHRDRLSLSPHGERGILHGQSGTGTAGDRDTGFSLTPQMEAGQPVAPPGHAGRSVSPHAERGTGATGDREPSSSLSPSGDRFSLSPNREAAHPFSPPEPFSAHREGGFSLSPHVERTGASDSGALVHSPPHHGETAGVRGPHSPNRSTDRLVDRPLSQEERHALVRSVLTSVELNPDEVLGKWPHQLSGGQRQRVMCARALLVKPRLLVADEPTSMLDASLRVALLNLLLDIREQQGTAILFITHDIGQAYYLSDRILVMYRGELVEQGPVEQVLHAPAHPYTRRLLADVPRLRPAASSPPPHPPIQEAGV